ncbi:hypothetical protein [Turneriella parva]|jgi:type II secretory pathway component PulC|uniref:PDZ/DHR/GLGF domain protein n=1 Tax=Turneriella parva (strain ATCC BAA-1111 / DSM 21527 / NCTC 11395 / H) TaxID=869212 RepID=I4BBU3_TURPD|nr:hypothetical protein [Turneriella parva]AFM14750.1 hypothetical protein Turpa_4117 [Turneriella parva DSM 21527]
MQATRHKRYLKPLAITVALLLAIAAAVLVREYLVLRSLAASFAAAKNDTLTTPDSGRTEKAPAAQGENVALISQVKTSAGGNRVDARVSFKAFKRLVEANPKLAQSWGRIGWKVLGDVPALCLRIVAPGTAFTKLGVQSGDCITHFDGETVNQPLRNLGIWLTLGSRKALKVDTVRAGQRISYHLTAN